MPRIRSLKPEYWADEDLADLPRDARLLYMGLWNLADEWARLRGDSRYVKGQLFPYDDDLTPGAIEKLLDLLVYAGKAYRYEVDGRSFMFLPNLSKHQRLEPSKVDSKLPAPPSIVSESSQPEPRADEPAPNPDEPAPDAESNALLYVSGSMEQGTRADTVSEAPGPDPTSPEPPSRCDKHLKIRNPPNCGACKEARHELGQWLAARTARLASSPRCAVHPHEIASNCGACRFDELGPA